MQAPTLTDLSPSITELNAKIGQLKKAPLFQKAAIAEEALELFMQYLTAQDQRIAALEKGGHRGTE